MHASPITRRPTRRELIRRALEREATGILHCCGGEHVDRATLARRAAAAFGLDPDARAHRTAAGAAVRAGAVRHAARRDGDVARLGVDAARPRTAARHELRLELDESVWATT